ncbi:MAG: hypothetical protein WC728_15365 [Elusimicrobiota bacterium]
MPNTDWSSLSDTQLLRYAEYHLRAEFTSYGFDASLPQAVEIGGKRFDLSVQVLRAFKPVSFQKADLAVLTVFMDGKPPMLYLLPAEAWDGTDPLFSKGKDALELKLGKGNLHLLANYGFDFTVRRLVRRNASSRKA